MNEYQRVWMEGGGDQILKHSIYSRLALEQRNGKESIHYTKQYHFALSLVKRIFSKLQLRKHAC